MSACGKLMLSTEQACPKPLELIRLISEATGAERANLLRSAGPHRGWEAALENLRRTLGRVIYSSSQTVRTFEPVADRQPIDRALEEYRDGSCLWIDYLGPYTLAQRIEDWFGIEGDHAIIGDFLPTAPFLRIGWHDIVDFDEEHMKPVHVARPFLTLGFFGYGYPNNEDRAVLVPELLRNPVIAELRQRLEAMVGPLTPYLEWSC